MRSTTTKDSRRDRDLEHSVVSLAKEGVGVGDPIERKPVGEQWREIHAPSPHELEEPAHTLPGQSVVTMR